MCYYPDLGQNSTTAQRVDFNEGGYLYPYLFSSLSEVQKLKAQRLKHP
jgi:hypothetical protein